MLSADARVALLNLAEKAFLSREQHTLAKSVERAAIQHHPTLLAAEFKCWLPLSEAQQRRSAVGNLVIKMPVGILRPGIESPVCYGNSTFRIPQKDGPRVARPDAI